MKTFEDVFDEEDWNQRLLEIRQQGESDFAAGKIVGLKWTYDFALRFAEMHEQAPSGNLFTLGAVRKFKEAYSNSQVVEAMNTVVYLLENGKPLGCAMSYRPAVFSRELVAAINAAEADRGNYSKHLLDFVKYRRLLGAMHDKFQNRDYKGLRESLLGASNPG